MTTTHALLDPRVHPALRPSIPALTLAVIGATLSGVAGLAATWGVVSMIGDPSPGTAAAVCAALLLAAALSAASSWLAHAAEARFEARLRREIAAHTLRLPATRLTTLTTDRLRRLVADDVAALHHMIAHLPAEVATMIVVPLCAVALLLALAGPLALLALIPGVIAAIAYLAVLPKLSAKHGEERGRVMGEITTAVDDYARGIHIFRSFGAASGALADYSDATQRFTSGMVAWVKRVATPAAVAVALLQAVASYAIAYAVGATADTATLAAILLLSLALVTPALRLGHGLDYVTSGRAAAARIGELLAEPLLPRGDAAFADDGSGVIAAGLSLAVGDRQLLADATLRAPAGAITAITGPSGAGKSTILRLLAGLESPTTGTVRIGGSDLAALSEDALAGAAILIPQAVPPLSATVLDNLRLVAPLATAADCEAALDRAQLDAPLAAAARTLSGGERQRLAIARAFLSPAAVILADEPTSALDATTAERLWGELESLARDEGRTVVVVTHDPRLAARADERCAIAPAHPATEGIAR